MPQATSKLGAPSPALGRLQQNALAGYLLLRLDAIDAPAGDPNASLELEILSGEPASIAIDELVAARVVSDAFLLRSYMRYRGLDVGVEAGLYNFNGGMSIREIAEQLQTAQPFAVTIRVIPGWRAEEVAAALPESELEFNRADFMQAVQNPSPEVLTSIGLETPTAVEGFLFPDTYRIEPKATAGQAVAMMVEQFDERVGSDLLAGFQAQGLTLLEAVTLASIIEREAVLVDEQALIASVFLNRLSLGMSLDADPTVQYALGQQTEGWWKSPLSLADLEIDSPYNTYVVTGLPPGPIANPGIEALRAVAFPADSDFLYFRARCDGSGGHAFAHTFEEHLQNACP
jgi:UPF0755 protein